MDKYKLLYIDEEPDFRRAFLRFAEPDFDVVDMHPLVNMEDLLSLIFEENAHAVIVDHLLNEKDDSIAYDGASVVSAIRKYRDSFPCFILTSYDYQAVSEADDVNLVYPKSYVHLNDDDSTEHVSLKHKIKIQIEHYLKRLSEAEKELLDLKDKAVKDRLDIVEEDRLIYLDNLLSKELNKKYDIPSSVKRFHNIEKIQELIDISKSLLDEIKS